MANLTEFRNALKSGLARQHKWAVTISFPTFAASGETSRQAKLLARTTATPSSNLGVIDLGWGGRVLPCVGDRTFDPFEITFINVNDSNVRNAFERWQQGMNTNEGNIATAEEDEFRRDIQLDLLDAQDNVVKTYILRDAFPSVVGQSDLDSGAMDSYQEFPVTFRYILWESDTTA